MNSSAALSSLNATYRYLKHMLSEQRPAEIDAVQAYLDRIKPYFEEAAKRNSCLIEWQKPVVYVQELFKRLPTISQYAQFSRSAYVQSDSTQEFVIFNGVTRKESTGLLFIENSFASHSVNCRILSQTGEFELEGRGSLDFIMKPPQWSAHEALMKKAVAGLLGKKAAARQAPASKAA